MTQYSQEVKDLARRWGQPRLIENQIPVAPGLEEKTVRDFFSDRWAEVMMVIRRTVDGLLWVMTKASFPQRLYSLPTGGIRPQERIGAALWRELREETGFDAQLQRFLAVIRYVPLLAPGDPQEVPSFVSYVFLLEEMNGDDPMVTGGEKILDFKAVAPGELLEIAHRWRELSGSSSEFHDLAAWGMFRGIAHQVVGEILISGEK
ncbi:MAG: NUDIX hydrolase [Anaerolineae bacterium]|jgi:ADP-ribose pyrophosphatase YjhB (NUDIX family)